MTPQNCLPQIRARPGRPALQLFIWRTDRLSDGNHLWEESHTQLCYKETRRCSQHGICFQEDLFPIKLLGPCLGILERPRGNLERTRFQLCRHVAKASVFCCFPRGGCLKGGKRLSSQRGHRTSDYLEEKRFYPLASPSLPRGIWRGHTLYSGKA